MIVKHDAIQWPCRILGTFCPEGDSPGDCSVWEGHIKGMPYALLVWDLSSGQTSSGERSYRQHLYTGRYRHTLSENPVSLALGDTLRVKRRMHVMFLERWTWLKSTQRWERLWITVMEVLE